MRGMVTRSLARSSGVKPGSFDISSRASGANSVVVEPLI